MMATKDEKNNFSTMILSRAEFHSTDCMDAIITYCDEIGLEVEIAGTLVNEVLKSRIEEEAQKLRYLPRSAKLPI